MGERSWSALKRVAVAVAIGVLAAATGVGTATGADPPGHASAPKVLLVAHVHPAGSRSLIAHGKVKPAPKVGAIVLQVRRAGAWRRLARGPLHRGAFSIHATLRGDATAAAVRALLLERGRRVAASAVHSLRLRRRPRSPSPRQSPPSGRSQEGGSAPPPIPTPPAEDPLSAGSLMRTVESYASLPNHLSGTANGAAAEDEFEAGMAAAGLSVGEQAFTYPRFAVGGVGLSAGGTTVPPTAIAPLLYSGTTPAGGVTAPLFDGGTAAATPAFTASEVTGKIVVVSVRYEHNSKAVGLYPAIGTAVEGEAAGFVAVTQTVGDYPKWEDVNARDGTGELPVLMVGKGDGKAVIAAAEGGEAGTLTLAADTSGVACERDVWGELEGADPSRRVFVGTPTTSFTPSASEHGSGVAIAVGLARHYAALPRSERPETLVFMALGGHEVGWLGLQALLASPQGAWLQDADAYVHLGSALGAPLATEEPDGTIHTTSTPDPTGRLHDSENPLLEGSVIEDFEAAGVPTPETPPHTASGGEQTNAYAVGIPTASFSGASLFFHTAGDLPGTVNPTILTRDADAFRRVVDTITAIPAGLLKVENGHAEQLGAEIDAAARAPVNPTLGAGGTLGSKGIGGPPATPVASCP